MWHAWDRGEKCTYKVLVEKPERKRPLGRPRCRREDGIRIDLRETGRGGGVNWILLAEDRDGWRAIYSYIPMDIYRYISID
jgi:hypothetical protein